MDGGGWALLRPQYDRYVLEGRNFLVIYDPERDEFSHESAARLVRATREWPQAGRRR